MTTAAIKCETFGDMISLVERRGRIKGDVQTEDRDIIKGYLNEYYISICTERRWQWRSFDRVIVFKEAVDDGTIAVTNGSRIVTFSEVTISDTLLGKSISVTGEQELYRIIGVDTVAEEVYLEAEYVGTNDATASYKMYQYEFPLPPDCDNVNQVYIMQDFYNPYGELDGLDFLRFNQILSISYDSKTLPRYYTIDSRTFANASLAPLDEMVLDYDFLGGDRQVKVERIRFFPLEPDVDRVLHVNYNLMVKEMNEDDDKPIIPIDDRWVLVHFALYEWFKDKGNHVTSDKEYRDAKNKLNEMRAEFRKTKSKPRFLIDVRGNHKSHGYNNIQDLFRASREKEWS